MQFRTVSEITITHTLSAKEDALVSAVAIKLLFTSFQSMPVLDYSGKVVGKVTEMDLLKALMTGKDLRTIQVNEIMSTPSPVVTSEIPLEETIVIIDANRLTQLPVMKDGRFIGSVTRHDLLRAWLGEWVDHEKGSYAEVLDYTRGSF